VAEREKRTGSAQRAGKLQTMPDEFSIIKLSDTTRTERGTNMNDTAKCDREIGRPEALSSLHRPQEMNQTGLGWAQGLTRTREPGAWSNQERQCG
jgi:hypothetical protein